MRLVDFRDGALEMRWTWLPYWVAAGPQFPRELEQLVRDVVIINGMPRDDESLARIETFILRRIEHRFQIEGLTEYIAALRFVREE